TDGVLAVHSLSKRSNMAGLRSGFVVGDGALIQYLGEVRKHGGLMMPAPVQAATAAALGDDEHVAEQRARYARRRAVVLPALEARGLVHDGGSSTFYLWLRDAERGRDDLFAVLPEGDARAAVLQAVELLDTGEARVAELVGGDVVVHEWLKEAVLLLFRLSHMETIELGPFEYADKIPLKRHFQRQ